MSNSTNSSTRRIGHLSLENMPPEILIKIAQEVLGLKPGPVTKGRMRGGQNWPFDYRNQRPLDVAILRTNRYMHHTFKHVLDSINEWVVFDIDHAYLLLPCACFTVPMIMVDPEAGYALPQGIMQIRLQLSLPRIDAQREAAIHRCFPRRLTVLVPASVLEAFLEQLRIMEFGYGSLETPGNSDQNGQHPAQSALVRHQKLCLGVAVRGGVPQYRIREYLELFRMFWGPLNDVYITGAEDIQQARSVHRAIRATPNREDAMLQEVIMRVIAICQQAHQFACAKDWAKNFQLSNQASRLSFQTFFWKPSPWADFPHSNHNFSSQFEVLGLCIPGLNILQGLVLSGVPQLHSSVDAFIEKFPGDHIECLLSVPEMSPVMRAWITLFCAMLCIFCVHIGDDYNTDERVSAIQYGMYLFENTASVFEHLPEAETLLFRTMSACHDRLKVVENEGEPGKLYEAVCSLHPHIQAPMRPIRWQCHKSFISRAVDEGILKLLTKSSDMTDQEKKEALVVNVFATDEEDDEYYCI
jgi:hypothetical protein